MQSCKSIVPMVFECYFFKQLLHRNVCRYGLHYNVLLEMMMSEIEGLTKGLYFIILCRRKTSFHAKFQVQCLHGLPLDVGMACIIMYCGLKSSFFKK